MSAAAVASIGNVAAIRSSAVLKDEGLMVLTGTNQLSALDTLSQRGVPQARLGMAFNRSASATRGCARRKRQLLALSP